MFRRSLIRIIAGALGVAALATSGATVALAAPTEPNLKLNEIETDGSPDWAELINLESSPLDISGFVLAGRGNDFRVSIPPGTVVQPGEVYVAEAAELKLKKNDRLSVYAADGTTLLDSHEWGDFHLSTWGRLPNGIGGFTPLSTKSKGVANPAPSEGGGVDPDDTSWKAIKLNEVTSANVAPYQDAYELFNSGDTEVDVAAWLQSDSGSTPRALNAPNGTVVPAGGYLVLLSNQGLSSDGDAVKLYLSDGTTLVDQVSWGTTDAQPGSWSACGDGSGAWLHTERESWGESNAEACSGRIIDTSGSVPCQTEPASDLGAPLTGGESWPGSQKWNVSDTQCQFNSTVSGQDVSGLDIDPDAPQVMWAVKNKSHLYKLIKSGSLWVKDTREDWAEGKRLVFPSGTGEPDSEGITVGPDGALYVTTERDNLEKNVALDSVLRYDPAESGTTLHPTAQWVLTGDFAGVIDPGKKDDANLGFEGITWVPDAFLVANGFVDEHTGRVYDPTDYDGHGSGLFFLALEKNGHLYAYALNADGTHTRVAEIDSGMPRIAETQWDGDNERIWTVADDSVGGSSTLMTLTGGKFVVDRVYDRPAELANLNLEGFALAPDSTCVGGAKEAIRSDDGNNGGHSLWSGAIDCDLALSEGTPIRASVSATPATVPAGGRTTIVATGLAAQTEYTVVMHSKPVELGSARSDLDGRLTLAEVTIPANTAQGMHTITVATVADPDTVLASFAVTITANPHTGSGGSQLKPDTLARTGSDPLLGFIVFTCALFAASASLTVLSRRRPSRR